MAVVVSDEFRQDDEDEDEEDWEDPDVTMRKQILEEVMERHPDMAFTGDSVQRYTESGDELESAGNDFYLGEWF